MFLGLLNCLLFSVLNEILIMVALVTKDKLSILKNWWVSLGGYKRLLMKGNNNVGYFVSQIPDLNNVPN